MNAEQALRDSIEVARRAADAVVRAIALEEIKSRSKAAEIRSRIKETKEARATLELPPSWAGGVLAGKAWKAAASVLGINRKAAATLDGIVARAERELDLQASLWRKRRIERDRFSALSRRLAAAADTANQLSTLPDSLREQARGAGLKTRSVRGKGKHDRKILLDASELLFSIVAAWKQAEASARQAARQCPGEAPTTSNERVYLPIPYAMGHHARAAGALYDPDIQKGSRWFVPPGADLAPFERFLPLAYRHKAPKLSFPPVPYRASSHNLWSVFDATTWDTIRNINYERTGRRCVLCGKQSGNLLKCLEEDGERRVGTVDCHEIWEWTVPDPEVSIGVQKLKALIPVCFECHATFHSSYARTAARARGIEDEVRRFLMKRRAFLTRKDPVTVALEMKADRERLQKMSDTRLWIVDLSHLARQDYMTHVQPVFVERNAPGVRPGQISGLSFITDEGAFWPEITATDLHASLADIYRIEPVPMRGRRL